VAILYFVRDGVGIHTSPGHDVRVDVAEGLLPKYATKYFKSGPVVNEGEASPFSPYRHVILEVLEGETTKLFPQSGYYYFIGLSPKEARSTFQINNEL